MKSYYKLIGGTLTLFVVAMLAITGASFAQTKIQEGSESFSAGSQVFDRTIYRAGQSIAIYDVVNGDVYCAGNKIVIDGVVNGDVICAGSDVVIGGSVTGDIRIAGNRVEVSGEVDGNATIFAADTVVTKKAIISGDLTGATRSTTINGKIGRDISLRSESVRLTGEIGRNVQSYHNSFVFDGDGNIGGNFKYASPNRVYIPNGAVGGDVQQESVEPSTKYSSSLTSTVFLASFLYIAWFVSLLISALGIAFLFPKSLEDSVYYATKQPFASTFAGLLSLTVVPIAIIFLLLTIVGIPLALIFGFMLGTVVLLSTPFVAHLIGSLLIPNRSHPVKALAGAAILLLVYAIPLINIIGIIIVTILGSGLVIRVSAQRYSIAHREYYGNK